MNIIDYKNYELKVINMQREFVYSINDISNYTININIGEYSAGVYNLILHSKDTLEEYLFKIFVLIEVVYRR